MNNAGTLTTNGASGGGLANEGTLNNYGGGTLTVNGGGELTNYAGTLNNYAGGR